jgi:hypothetical protein
MDSIRRDDNACIQLFNKKGSTTAARREAPNGDLHVQPGAPRDG